MASKVQKGDRTKLVVLYFPRKLQERSNIADSFMFLKKRVCSARSVLLLLSVGLVFLFPVDAIGETGGGKSRFKEQDIPHLLAGQFEKIQGTEEYDLLQHLGIAGHTHQADHPVKCLTPWILLYGEIKDHIDPNIRKQIDEILHLDQQAAEIYISPSGRFHLEFFREGTHAVPGKDENASGIPDYIERAAEFADYSWQLQVGDLGFEDPASNTPLLISFRNIGSRAYGYTIQQGQTTRIVAHNTFQNFPPNDDPEGNQMGALKVTIAHELKHSIQFATNRWQGDLRNVHWLEMDATMMENIVYPQVNDYYNYIRGRFGIFGDPRKSTPVAYHHVTWSLFYADHLGMEYWVDVWREVRDEHLIRMERAMKQALNNDPDIGERRFRELFTRNHIWHATSGSRTVNGYGFRESAAYPDAVMEEVYQPMPELYTVQDELASLSGVYRMFYPVLGQIGPITFSATYDQNTLGVGVLGYHRNGGAMEWIMPMDESGQARASSRFSVSELDSFLVVVVNAGRDVRVSYTIEMNIESIPDVVTLESNYPNPFTGSTGNSSTTIAFSVPEREHATILVYDVLGRKVARLFDQEVEPGRYTVPFDARGLSSGVYIYQLRTGSMSKAGKMTYIR